MGAKKSGTFLEQRMTDGAFMEIAGGRALIFSTPAPFQGRVNQDAAGLIDVNTDCGVLAVADGAGGLPAGARASALAITSMEGAVLAGEEESIRSRILDGFERANQAIMKLGVGAATTLAVAEIQQQILRPYHVGDSTILVVGQRGKRKLLTVSHSPVGYQVEAGVLHHEAALHHEDLAVVSNLVGNNEMRIEVGAPLHLSPYDTVVIGSDGLFDNLHIKEIVERVRVGPLDKAAASLVKLCSKRMLEPEDGQPSKPDDLTFVLYRIRPRKKRKRKK